MGVFEGVFTKRGAVDVPDCPSAGPFEELFVRRLRWRNHPIPAPEPADADVSDFNAAKNLDPVLTAPSKAALANAAVTPPEDSVDPMLEKRMVEIADATELMVKNTFLKAVNKELYFDSLKDFLKERKVQSCPVSRAVSIDDILQVEAALKQEAFNTASTLGDIDISSFVPYFRTQSFDDAESLSKELACNFRTHSFDGIEPALKDIVFNTASTFMDHEFEEALQQSSCQGAAHDSEQLPAYDAVCQDPMLNAASAFGLGGLQLTPEERLNKLRNAGSAIQESISQTTFDESLAAFGQLPLSQMEWYAAEQMLMCGASQEQQQQQQLFLPPPPPPIATDGFVMQELSLMSALLPPPPVAAAPQSAPSVLRLSDAIAPPELGSPQLPSIGSLLHHRGGCRPCTFFHTRGCENKEDCQFCHLCGPGEKKKRLKGMKAAQRAATLVALEVAKARLASYNAAEAANIEADDMVVE